MGTNRYIILILSILFVPGMLYAQSLDFRNIHTPVLLKGDSVTAYRDPMAIFHNGEFYLYFTLTKIEKNDSIYMYIAFSKSSDLIHWSPVHKITKRDQKLNFSSPGNIIQYNGEWIMCMQTYPRPGYTKANMPMYGDSTSRLFIMRSKDLISWSAPELLLVKGDDVAEKKMGRMIDPFLLADHSEKGKWWIFYKQNGASRSYSYDLKHWTYSGYSPAGENLCIVWNKDEYIMFHSPENGIGIKRSTDLIHWKDEPALLTLGQADWTWAKGRITAGFILPLEKKMHKQYLLFFHGSGPKKEAEGDFDKNASIGFAWSKDIKNWEWNK